MLLPIIALVAGLIVLVFSADKFVNGAVGVAKFCGMSTLLIGMVIIGFGTSAPELTVSVLSAMQGNPQLSLGNAYGSNIANIALILGATAIIAPVTMKRIAITHDLPILAFISLISIFLVYDGSVVRSNGSIMLALFAIIMIYNTIREARNQKSAQKIQDKTTTKKKLELGKPIFWLIIGLVLLIVSSRLLVWGAVEIASALGVSDLLIGLTIVAIGTSLPELASSIAATRKGQNDLALGNIIGSNLFNTLAVVGIAAVISPMQKIDLAVIHRDMPLMTFFTIALIIIGLKFGKLSRIFGCLFLALYMGYITLLILEAHA